MKSIKNINIDIDNNQTISENRFYFNSTAVIFFNESLNNTIDMFFNFYNITEVNLSELKTKIYFPLRICSKGVMN